MNAAIVIRHNQPSSPLSIAQCQCCGSVYTKKEWEALASRRPWSEFDLEIAECKCGSTISVER